ncbi:membrane-associating domain-containing protein [Sarocladium implicatum]|nr:membrane-associating domain-containing protein [Sarocladium implicatum]
MAKFVIFGLRGLQAVLALGNLGLSAYLIDWYLAHVHLSPPHIINFLLVTPILSLLSILYLELAPRFAPRACHAFAAFAIEFLNTLFYFSGFIALAAFLSQLRFCNGPQCAAGQAQAVVAAINFVAWLVSTVLVSKDVFKGGLRAPSSTGSWGNNAPATRTPPMAQV